MIRVDAGRELCELLVRAEQLAGRGRLDVAVPFFDSDSRLWQQLIAAAKSGAGIRLLTRPAVNGLQIDLFNELRSLGVRLVHLPRIHAKSVLLSDRCGRHSMGWIGSHNFTKASESVAQELGVAFRGHGSIEAQLHQQALLQLDGWEYHESGNRTLTR